MDQLSQKCFSSALVLQVHARFPHDLRFLLSGFCKGELVIPFLRKKKEESTLQPADTCFCRKTKAAGDWQPSQPEKLPL